MSKKKQNHWWPRYQDDYSKKTAHLTLAEHGAYAVLLDYYYATENPLDANADVLHRICRAFDDKEQAAVHSVLRQFFVLVGGKYHNNRADAELAKRIDISGKRRDAALIKHAGKGDANADANADTPTPTPTLSIKEDTNVSSVGSVKVNVSKIPHEFPMSDGTILNFDQLFERLWVLYPAIRDKGSKAKAKEQLKIKIEKGIDYEIIGRGVAKYRGYCDRTGEKQPDMFRWIRDGGYSRDYATTEPQHNPRNSGGYSIEAVVEKAMADKTHDPEGRDARLAALGICYDTSDQ